MMRENYNSELPRKEKSNDIDLKFIVGKALGNWYWFVISVIVFVVLGVLFMLVVTPKYNVAAKVMVTGPNPRMPSGSIDENALLADGGNLSVANYSNVNNELQVLHSRTLIMQTVRDMQLNVTYWQKQGLLFRESYKRSPFTIDLMELKSGPVYMLYDPQVYKITFGKDKLNFEDQNTDSTFSARFGDTIKFNYGTWVLQRNPGTIIDTAGEYELKIGSYGGAFNAYNENIIAVVTTIGVTTIDLTLSSPVKDKGEDYISHVKIR